MMMAFFRNVRRISMFSGFGLVKKGMRSEFGVLGLVLWKDGHSCKICVIVVSVLLQNLHWLDGG